MIERHGNRLYGMRHGRSEANEAGIIVSDPVRGCQGYGLSLTGRTQVADAASASASHLGSDTVIYCSPFLRTLETARLLADGRGVDEVIPDDRLVERHFGTLEGLSDENYGQVWELDCQDPRHTHWQGESVWEVWQRFESLWRECGQRYTDRTIVFVAHGDVLTIGSCGLNQADLNTHHERFAFATAELRLLR